MSTHLDFPSNISLHFLYVLNFGRIFRLKFYIFRISKDDFVIPEQDFVTTSLYPDFLKKISL